jgi:adenine phosphoribosyltransferase
MQDNRITKIRNIIRDIPDYPKKGILFKDITTLLQDSEHFNLAIDVLIESVQKMSFDAVAAIESRGFIFGSVLSYEMGIGFIPIRKPGKLPADVISEEYALEYGTDKIEMHKDAIAPGQKILIVDDLLATGGTAKAACNLIEKSGGSVEALLFLIELSFLNGRNLFKGYKVTSIIDY